MTQFYIKKLPKVLRYLESLNFDEIQALNLNLTANGGGIQPLENYSDCVELLQAFDYFIISMVGHHIQLVYYQYQKANFLLLQPIKKYRLKNYTKNFVGRFLRICFCSIFMPTKSFFC